LRKCCDYYDITIVDEDAWNKWPLVHHKRDGGWGDGYGYNVYGKKGTLRIPVIKDVLFYANIFGDE
jgi:hypothetical protein